MLQNLYTTFQLMHVLAIPGSCNVQLLLWPETHFLTGMALAVRVSVDLKRTISPCVSRADINRTRRSLKPLHILINPFIHLHFQLFIKS